MIKGKSYEYLLRQLSLQITLPLWGISYMTLSQILLLFHKRKSFTEKVGSKGIQNYVKAHV